MPTYRHKRGTRAQIDAAAALSQLKVGEAYFITDENRLTVAQAVNAHTPAAKQSEAGGSDPWTRVVLAADFVTSSATAVNVTGLLLTPTANKRYEVYGRFLLRTATATVGPRPGCTWPTGLTEGAVRFKTPSSATAELTAYGNKAAAVLTAVGGLPLTTDSFLGEVIATIIAGASPSGNFQIQLASETAGTNVTMKAGSWLAHREY